MNELHDQSKVFKEIPGRKHHSFPNIRRNLFATIEWDSLEEWFKKQSTFHGDSH